MDSASIKRAVVWSGDINSDWIFFKKQIRAGLNYSICGLRYWTTDIGGFVSGNPDDPAYRELFIRWFEFGAFNPILLVHGTRSTNQKAIAQCVVARQDLLRFYSLAWMTSSQGYTPMRGLHKRRKQAGQSGDLLRDAAGGHTLAGCPLRKDKS